MKNDLSISQNFLVDPNFVEKLIKITSITDLDVVIDIGAGKGIITEALSKKAKEVIAIELDRTFSSNLKVKFKYHKNIKVINEDFLKYLLPNEPYKVFSNPPFNISADVLNKLLKLPNNLECAYLFLQDKTVDRFISDKNQIAVLYKPFYDILIIEKVSRKEFLPTPKVDIVFVKFEKRINPLIDMINYQLYRDFVIYGFNQWKPTLLEAFNKVFTKEQLNIINRKYNLANLRPSELTTHQWIGIFDTFLHYVSDDKKLLVVGYESRQLAKQKGMVKRNRTTV